MASLLRWSEHSVHFWEWWAFHKGPLVSDSQEECLCRSLQVLLRYKVAVTHTCYRLCTRSELSVFLGTFPVLLSSWKCQVASLEEISLWFGWELADCHLSVAGSGQDAGSPLGRCHMTQPCIVSAVQTRPITVLLSVWEARGDAHVLALWVGCEAFFWIWQWTPSVDPLS